MKRNPGLRSMISDDKKLELRLAPPSPEQDKFPIFLGHSTRNNGFHGAKRAFEDTLRSQGVAGKQKGFLKSSSSVVAEILYPDKNAFSVAANTAVTDGSNKRSRTAPAPVVGWPPIGSFRKNLAAGGSSLSKPDTKPDETTEERIAAKSESLKTNLFVKINMEGVAIGRKINLSAYNSYEELSFAIDELFKGLLPVQQDLFAAGCKNKMEGSKIDTSSVAKSDEYTLLYEDNEGDRMLVGDVPWHMFVSTVKKLLVLKSAELSTLLALRKKRLPLDRVLESDDDGEISHVQSSKWSNFHGVKKQA